MGGAAEAKDRPFVVAVLGDFTEQLEQPLPKLKERKLVDINPENFDLVLEAMHPHLSLAFENKLTEDANTAQLKVDLRLNSMDDFGPENDARLTQPLRKLLGLRSDKKFDLKKDDRLPGCTSQSLMKGERQRPQG
jgi:type VI secretion system protein ImpB